MHSFFMPLFISHHCLLARHFLNIHYLLSAADEAYTDALKENQKFSVSRCYLVSSLTRTADTHLRSRV